MDYITLEEKHAHKIHMYNACKMESDRHSWS